MSVLAPERPAAPPLTDPRPPTPDPPPDPPRRRPGRSRTTPAVETVRDTANASLNGHGWLIQVEAEARQRTYAEPTFETARLDFLAGCELLRPVYRAWQMVLEWELEVADGRIAA